MRAQLLLVPFALLLCLSAGRAAPRIVGGSAFAPAYVAELVSGDSSDAFAYSRATLEDSLVALGYLGAQVVRLSADSLVYERGERYTTLAPAWFGDSSRIPTIVFDRVPLREGSEFEFWKVREAALQILEWCDEHGLPFAAVHTDSFEISHIDQSVRPHLRVLAGPEIKIAFVNFTGNTTSLPRLLMRESRLREGEVYGKSRVAQARRRLAQLEYLRRVDEPRIVIDEEGKSGLVFNVEEGRLSRIDAVAGLAPAPEGEAQSVTGLVDLQVMNLFGTGRRGKVFWQRPSRDVQELALAWREPWIAATPLRADLSFAQRVEDTLYVTRKFGVRAGYPVLSTVEIFAGVVGEELLADSGASAQLNLVPTRTRLIESGFVVDTRDHATNPRSGLRFESVAATGERRADRPPPGSDRTKFSQRRAQVDGEFFRELIPNWIVALSGHGRAVFSDEPEIPVSDLFKVGGARTMRGYREEQFAGSQAGWGSVEARYWLGQASRFAAFTDLGVIVRESRVTDGVVKTTVRRAAYGFGVRLETGVGVWGVDYGIAGGSSALDGQLHVSLLSLF